MNLTPFLFVWIALVLVMLGVYVWRSVVARKEDDKVHVLDDRGGGATAEQVAAAQEALAARLGKIEKLAKRLLYAVLAYGVCLGAAYVYAGWVAIP